MCDPAGDLQSRLALLPCQWGAEPGDKEPPSTRLMEEGWRGGGPLQSLSLPRHMGGGGGDLDDVWCRAADWDLGFK